MSMFNEYEVLSVTCPACGKPILQTLGWFRISTNRCPHCDHVFLGDAFNSVLTTLEHQALELFKNLKP